MGFVPVELNGWDGPVWRAEETDSTNAEVFRRAVADVPTDGICVWALHQTAGRGRLGRRWESPLGRGLMISVGYPHVTDLTRIAWLNVAAAAAARAAIDAVVGRIDGLGIKWPNDLVVMTPPPSSPAPSAGENAALAYRKLGGVLTETATETDGPGRRVAVGVGLNLNHRADDFAPEFRSEATSLFLETGREWALELVLIEFLQQFRRREAQLRSGNPTAIRDEVLAFSVLIGRTVTVQQPTRHFTGTARTLDDMGRLVIQSDDTGHEITLDAGEVTQIRLPR